MEESYFFSSFLTGLPSFTAQPPFPLQEFLPPQPLSPVLQPPLPLQEFLPAHEWVSPFSSARTPALSAEVLPVFCAALARSVPPAMIPARAAPAKMPYFDRPEESRFVAYIGSLCGIGMKSLHDRDSVPDRAKLYFSGRLACQTRNAEGLHAILEGFFGIRTVIEEFSGYWMRILPMMNSVT